MSFITSSLSPYRSNNVWKEFREIIIEDHEWVCHSLKDRGFLFPIAYMVLMSMSLLKDIVFVFEQMRKPEMKGSNYDRRN